MSKKFIGDRRVASVQDLEQEHLVRVEYEYQEGRAGTEVLNRRIYEILESPKPLTPSDVREKRVRYIAKQVLELLLRFNLKTNELESLMQLIIYSFSENEKQLLRYIYRRDGEKQRDLDDLSMLEIEEKLAIHRPNDLTPS